MKKKFLLSSLLISGLVLTACAAPEEEKIATYEGGEITQQELYDTLKKEHGAYALEKLVLNEVLEVKYGEVTDDVVQTQYETDLASYGDIEGFQSMLDYSGYTEDTYKEMIRMNMLIEKSVLANTEIKDEDIQKAYDEYVPSVKAAHILVEEEDVAKDLIKQIKDGADFAKLATENSLDTGTSANGGELTFSSGEMVEPFEKAAFALEVGKMTDTPVQSEYGFHIIKMVEKPEKGTLEEEKESMEALVVSNLLSDSTYIFDVLAEILVDAKVTIVDEDLKGALDFYMNPEVVEEDVESGEETETTESEVAESEETSKESTEKEDVDSSVEESKTEE